MLGPTGNVQRAYEFLKLSTWKVIKRNSCTTMPMSQYVIDIVNIKASQDKKSVAIRDAHFCMGLYYIMDQQASHQDNGGVMVLPYARPITETIKESTAGVLVNKEASDLKIVTEAEAKHPKEGANLAKSKESEIKSKDKVDLL